MAGTPILVEMHPACECHDAGRGHPERPDRLGAVERGIGASGIADGLVRVAPRPARIDELTLVHDPAYVNALEAFCREGGGAIDADTAVTGDSWDAALAAAGGGLDAVERLKAGEADAAFVAVRPPGHHATPGRALGFCLFNNVAVTAAALAAAGERVLIVDIDAHHGNGTQEAFYDDGRVTYLSLHEWPLYPGTGRIGDVGTGAGTGETINVPLPRGTTGDVYLAAFDQVIAPVAERVAPTWLVLSAGFDAHRADPLTGLRLSSGDYGLLVGRLAGLVPAGRRIVVLEGGYDLEALTDCTASSLAALAGAELRPEPPTDGGPGIEVVTAVQQQLQTAE